MRRDVVSGILLIAGSLIGMVVMVLHPTGHDPVNASNFPSFARLNVMVHGAALASVPILFLGLMGLSRRLGPSDLSNAALVLYGFGSVAVIGAAVASGFVSTEIIERLLHGEAESRSLYHALLEYSGMVNQGFAKVHVVASSVSILLWSAAILTSRRMARAAGIAGAVAGAAVLVVSLPGYLPLNAHGFALVVFAQSGWWIWLGVLMCREGSEQGDQGVHLSNATI